MALSANEQVFADVVVRVAPFVDARATAAACRVDGALAAASGFVHVVHPFGGLLSGLVHEDLQSGLAHVGPPFCLGHEDPPFGLVLEDHPFDLVHEGRPYQMVWCQGPLVGAAWCQELHC